MSSRVGSKRKRGGSPQQKAYWANRRFSSLYPWSQAGAARIERGTALSTDLFGSSWKAATPQQRFERKTSGFTGRGMYEGRGKYRMRRTLGRFAKKHQIGKHAYNAGVAGLIAGATMGPEAILPAAAAGYGGRGLYGRGLYGRGLYGRGLYGSNNLISGGKPSMSINGGNSENQEITISHTEYVQDVYGGENSGFYNQGLPLNPGVADSLPWLSQLAANYEEYEFIQCVFHFKSTVDAGNTTNGATGTLIMATNYNPDQGKFVAKEPMMQYHGAVSARITQNCDHGIECDPDKNAGTATKFVRTTHPAGSQSKKDFDLGTFQWAVTNIPSQFFNQQIGELWCTYTVRLQKPRMYAALFKAVPIDRWVSVKTGTGMYPFDVFNPARANLSVTGINNQNSLGVQVEGITGSVSAVEFKLTFPDFISGTFKVSFVSSSAYTTCFADSVLVAPVLTGGISLLYMGGPVHGAGDPAPCLTSGTSFAANDRQLMFTAYVKVVPSVPDDAGDPVDTTMTLQFTGLVAAGNVCSSQLEISGINASYTDIFDYANGTSLNLNKTIEGIPFTF